MVREVAENDLLVRQYTFVYAAAYCHTRDANQRCHSPNFSPNNFLQVFHEKLARL